MNSIAQTNNENQVDTSGDDMSSSVSPTKSHTSEEQLDLSRCPAQRRASHWRNRRTDYYAFASRTNHLYIDCATLYVVSIAAATSATTIALFLAVTLRLRPIVPGICSENTAPQTGNDEAEEDSGVCFAPSGFHDGDGDAME